MKKSKLIAKSCFLAKYSVIIGITSSMLMACNGGSSTNSNNGTNIKPNQLNNTNTTGNLKDSKFPLSMGGGYDSFTNSPGSVQPCLKNASLNNIIINDPEYMPFTQISLNDIQNLLNVDIDSFIGGDRFSSSNEANFANYSKDTDYSTNIVYAYQIATVASFKQGSLGLGYDALTPVAKNIVNDPASFRSMCGDNYISQMNAGAFILVRLNLNFNSNRDKTNFLEAYRNTSLGNVLVSIQQTAASLNIPINIKMATLQKGGDPSKLPQLSIKDNLDDAKVTCSGAFTESCSTLINKVYQYAPTLINQIESSSGDFDPSKLYYYDPRLDKYALLEIPVPIAPNPSPAIMSAMRQLVAQYDNAVNVNNFVKHYQYVLANKLNITVQEGLKNIQAKLNNQINNVFSMPAFGIYKSCYRGYVTNNCLATRDRVESALAQYQLTDEESTLLNYLESNSYSARIINYYGESKPQTSDYHLSNDECIFAPIGTRLDYTYAVNCNGSWLATQGDGVYISPGFEGVGINISNFNYFSINPDNLSFGQWISYWDTKLLPDSHHPKEFNGIDAVKAANYYDESSALSLFKMNYNPI